MNTHSRRRFIIGLTALVAWPLKMFGKAARPLRGDEIKSSSETHVSTKGLLSFHRVADDAVIQVYDEAGNVIETHEHAGAFKKL